MDYRGFHLVFCPKYRKAVLVGPVAERLPTLLYAKAAELKATLHTMEIMPDHVHADRLCRRDAPADEAAPMSTPMRISGVLLTLGLLLWRAMLTHAGHVVLRWGSPLAWQAGAAIVVAATAASSSSSGGDTPNFADMVNLHCVSWTITGPCVCNPYTPCVQVEYWEPGWLVETVKRPGTTSLDLAAPLIHAAFDALGVPAFGGGGAGNASGSGHTNLQYNEVHVITFPQLLGGPCTGCAPGTAPFTLHYASEMDPLWRTAVAIPSPLDLLRSLGVWGRLYPRGGKAIHSSEPVGSGIAAARGMDIAFNPVGEPPNVEARVVLQRTDANSRCCQLASPRLTPCFPVGTPPLLWETGTVSPNGTYVWLFWRKRTCCVTPNHATCGITLVGTHGANACIIPSLSPP